MTKALIPKHSGNLANHTLKAGWPAPACRAVAALAVPWPSKLPPGVASTVGEPLPYLWGDMAPASTLAVYA